VPVDDTIDDDVDDDEVTLLGVVGVGIVGDGERLRFFLDRLLSVTTVVIVTATVTAAANDDDLSLSELADVEVSSSALTVIPLAAAV
jgi:hypothetical protein